MDREQLQTRASQHLEERKRLVCQWATGCGKSGTALKFIKNHPDKRVLILVPEQNNIQNWWDEFDKFDVPVFMTTIICYASLHKYQNTAWDLIVLDEVPHIDTEKRAAILRTMKADYVLALGAVITDEEINTLNSIFGSFLVWKITLHQAIKAGILPSPEVRVLHMSLDDTQKTRYHKGRFLTEKQYYDVLQEKVKGAVSAYNASATEFNKRNMLRAGNERKRFLGQAKEEAAKKVCSFLEQKNKRFICFCASIDQSKALGGEKSFTSKTPVSMKLLDRFNSKEINSLYVVGKLIEGQNLKDVDCGVIIQLGGTHRITVQESGRIMRSSSPLIYVPVFDGTKDDSFLDTITFNIPKDCIKHFNF